MSCIRIFILITILTTSALCILNFADASAYQANKRAGFRKNQILLRLPGKVPQRGEREIVQLWFMENRSRRTDKYTN